MKLKKEPKEVPFLFPDFFIEITKSKFLIYKTNIHQFPGKCKL